jgi:hypothetical protein
MVSDLLILMISNRHIKPAYNTAFAKVWQDIVTSASPTIELLLDLTRSKEAAPPG